MQFSYETKRLNLMILSADNAPLIQHFYQKNAAFWSLLNRLVPKTFIQLHFTDQTCPVNTVLS